MKLTLLINHDWTGGTALWSQELVKGLIAEGHEVSVIKSIRQKLTFIDRSLKRPEIKVQTSAEIIAAVHSLNPDLVILQSGFDNPTYVKKYPLWLEAIGKFDFPYTFATHDDAGSYASATGLHTLNKLLDSGYFIGQFLGFSQLPEELYQGRAEQIRSVLPFSVGDNHQVPLAAKFESEITLFSYVGKVKQWALLYRAAYLADRAKMKHPVHGNLLSFALTGGAASSPGVSPTTRAWEILQKELQATPVDLDVSDPNRDVHKPIPWNMELENGTSIAYTGKFTQEDVHQKMASTGMTLNTTTRRGGSLGPAEYVTLEAIRAGTPTVCPADNAYLHDHLGLTTFEVPLKRHLDMPSILRGKHDETVFNMIEAIEQEFTVTQGEVDKRRVALIESHSPPIVAKWIIDNLGVTQ